MLNIEPWWPQWLFYKSPTVNPQTELLKEFPSPNYNVEEMQIEFAWHKLHGDWEEFIHPSGATCNYNENKNHTITWIELSAQWYGTGTTKDSNLKPNTGIFSTWDVSDSPGNKGFANSPELVWYWSSPISEPLWPTRGSLDANTFTGCLRNFYINGLINEVDMRRFTDNFNAQSKSQTTVASIIMAVDASILAVPGLGSLLPTKTMSISFILSAYCIIACMVAQHFSHRMRSLDFVVQLLSRFCNLDLTII
ncbi:hypothetical protein BDR05DRAFT_953363 [Suillus weaverae]|nr:hypothetical protein BDR05DRAFT_953363 [Suillus weaverae]